MGEKSRDREFEADIIGYQYMATAGFEPEGCIRMLKVLGRIPGSEVDSTHPAIPKRIERMRELIVEKPPSSLLPVGESRIRTSQPLTYEPSKDGQSLRINSRHGGEAGDFFERKFGE